MQTIWNENHILLHGTVAESPTLSHVSHAVSYFVIPLVVSRLSGAEDVINVIVQEDLLGEHPVDIGDEVTVEGEVRSFNNKTGVGSRLVITVYAHALTCGAGEVENRLTLTGTICKPPICRRTPLGREICDLMVAVNRKYGRTDYLPCITWGGLAQRCGGLVVGDALSLAGRLQSRVYNKQQGEETQQRTAFEVSVMTLEPTQG